MNFRFRAFLTHLAISLIVVGGVLAILYAGWYRWPGWYLAGAETIIGLMLMVDLALGPLSTLIVSSPTKARREWRRDMFFIISVQLLAFGYGSQTLWAGRPIFYAFSLNRIQMVRAADFRPEAVEVARNMGAKILPDWNSPIRWIWARLPDDPQERMKIIYSTILGGEDVVVMPQHFHPWAEASSTMDDALVSVTRLAELPAWSEAEYRQRLDALDRAPEDVGVLPVKGLRRDGAWVFDRKTKMPLAFWPVSMWGLKDES